MKYIITTTLIILSLGLKAQTAQPQKKLPEVIHLNLKQSDYVALMNKIDSLQGLFILNSALPSNYVQSFNQRLNLALQPVYLQIPAQLIEIKPVKLDSVKVKAN